MSVSRRQVLTLYKRLLQLQRRMPAPLNTIGVEYIRKEFRQHKEVGPDHAQSFIQEWQARIYTITHMHSTTMQCIYSMIQILSVTHRTMHEYHIHLREHRTSYKTMSAIASIICYSIHSLSELSPRSETIKILILCPFSLKSAL